jgi:hypothetical protein
MEMANEAMNRWLKARNRPAGGNLVNRLRGKGAPNPAAPAAPADLGFKEFNTWAAKLDERRRREREAGS